MMHRQWFVAALMGAQLAACRPAYEDEGFSAPIEHAGPSVSAATLGDSSSPSSTAPPQPSCQAATCFENSSLPGLPSNLIAIGPAIKATSHNLHPAISGVANAAKAAVFTSDSDTALEAVTQGDGATALEAIAYAGSGRTIGVRGVVSSADGVPGSFVNRGGGDLLEARNSPYGTPAFRVANDGRLYVRGEEVGKTGPKGDRGVEGERGKQGAKGDKGATGAAGAPGLSSTFCSTGGKDCFSQCSGGVVVAAVKGECYVTSDTGGCSWGGTDGYCCVCSP